MNALKFIPTLLLCTLFFYATNLAAKPPKKTMDDAQIAAQFEHTGSVESKKLVYEHGKQVYVFKIKGIDKVVHVVKIDANTGKTVSHEPMN